MRLSAVAFLMILTTMFLSGCAQQKSASVENRGSQYYGRSAASFQTATMAAPVTSVMSAPVAAPGATKSTTSVSTSAAALSSTASAVSAPLTTAWQWPVEGKVIENFGRQKDGIASEGITIAAAEGAPIHAAQAGEVAFVGHKIRDYGNMVILRHGNGTLTSYAHTGDINVTKGQKVKAGTVIAYVGHTGSAKTPQLHFALREGDRAVDPLSKLPSRVASN